MFTKCSSRIAKNQGINDTKSIQGTKGEACLKLTLAQEVYLAKEKRLIEPYYDKDNCSAHSLF